MPLSANTSLAKLLTQHLSNNYKTTTLDTAGKQSKQSSPTSKVNDALLPCLRKKQALEDFHM